MCLGPLLKKSKSTRNVTRVKESSLQVPTKNSSVIGSNFLGGAQNFAVLMPIKTEKPSMVYSVSSTGPGPAVAPIPARAY